MAAYPQADQKQIDLESETHMVVLQDLIVSIRNLRAELKIEPKLKTPIQVYTHEPEICSVIEQNRGAIERQASVEQINFVETSLAKLPGARHTARFDVHVVYEQKIDIAAECERLQKEQERLGKALTSGQSRLENETFLAKAPTDVVEGLRKQVRENEVLLEKTISKRKELGCP
jgi:valyl-tRNA synthetase